jgi:hypothetical protein
MQSLAQQTPRASYHLKRRRCLSAFCGLGTARSISSSPPSRTSSSASSSLGFGFGISEFGLPGWGSGCRGRSFSVGRVQGEDLGAAAAGNGGHSVDGGGGGESRRISRRSRVRAPETLLEGGAGRRRGEEEEEQAMPCLILTIAEHMRSTPRGKKHDTTRYELKRNLT